jgi:hypothetical protein
MPDGIHAAGGLPRRAARLKQTEHKEISMKLTRIILLALAFAIPFASTTLASAADEAGASDTEKPAKKKGKKAKKGEEKKEGDEAAK